MSLAQQTTDVSDHLDTEAIRRRLDQERAELVRTLDDVHVATTAVPSDVPDGIGETEHLLNAQLSDVSSRVGALARQSLEELDAALSRLDSGTYGRCTGCGEQIPAERLEAMPAAGCCVGCQSSRERLFR